MKRLDPRRRLAIAAAPAASAASLLLSHWHAFGRGDAADALTGLVLGVGVGISLVGLIGIRRAC